MVGHILQLKYGLLDKICYNTLRKVFFVKEESFRREYVF